MKTTINCIILIATLTSSAAFASRMGPILTKSTYPGFTPPGLEQITSQCDVYHDRVEIKVTRHKDGNTTESKIVHKTELPENTWERINQSASGNIVVTQGPADAPSETYEAFQILPACGVKKVILYRFSEQIMKNESPAASQLVEYLDEVCVFE